MATRQRRPRGADTAPAGEEPPRGVSCTLAVTAAIVMALVTICGFAIVHPRLRDRQNAMRLEKGTLRLPGAALERSRWGSLLAAKAASAQLSDPELWDEPQVPWLPVELPKGLTFLGPTNRSLEEYRTAAGNAKLEAARTKIAEHVASPAYTERVRKLQDHNRRGILINAGGPKLLANLIITLKVLREVHNCTLPVEVAWQGPAEMDAATLTRLHRLFGPLRGFDVSKAQHPVEGLHEPGIRAVSYTGKVYALLHSHFRHVLLLDADSMPLQHPDVFFQHPQFVAGGALFWPDAWTGAVSPQAYSLFGLKMRAAKAALAKGKGYSHRDTESGQVLLDLGRHLDAVEYTYWINSRPELLQSIMWGDKDTFGLAFAAAGKAEAFAQVAVPPGGFFAWAPKKLLIKADHSLADGWQLLGFLQHDSWGRPAFLHRTINKYSLAQPTPLELLSAPMPRRWVEYYLAHDNSGPTKGIPWDYVVPDSAFQRLCLNPVVQRAVPKGTQWTQAQSSLVIGSCPITAFFDYLQIREAALPLDRDAALEDACMPVLQTVWKPADFALYEAQGLLENPQLRFLTGPFLDEVPRSDGGQQVMYGARYTPNNTPLPAYKPGDLNKPAVDGPLAAVLRGAYHAHAWMLEHKEEFPVLLHEAA